MFTTMLSLLYRKIHTLYHNILTTPYYWSFSTSDMDMYNRQIPWQLKQILLDDVDYLN